MKKWVRQGLLWGGALYIVTMVLFPLLGGERFDIVKMLLGVPLWVVTGLAIGYLFLRGKKR